MKNIKEYINHGIDILARNNYYYEELKNFYGYNIPQKYLNQYDNLDLISFEFIDENLNTHDHVKLQKKLLNEFGDVISGFKTAHKSKDKQSFFIKYFKDKNKEYSELKDDENFNNILGFFNYYVTGFYNINVEEDDDKIYKLMLIEPRYSDNVRDKLEKEHTRLYHFTDKKSADSILKSGLRCKKANYREFPERIFLWATNDDILVNNKLNKKIYQEIKNIIDWDSVSKNNGLSILRIDLYNKETRNINIYSDTAMDNENAVFVYNNIPAKFIKEISTLNIRDIV